METSNSHGHPHVGHPHVGHPHLPILFLISIIMLLSGCGKSKTADQVKLEADWQKNDISKIVEMDVVDESYLNPNVPSADTSTPQHVHGKEAEINYEVEEISDEEFWCNA